MSKKNLSSLNAYSAASAPGVGIAGDLYFDTATGRLNVSNGSAWAAIAPNLGSTAIATVGTITSGTWNAGSVTSSSTLVATTTISASGLAGSLLSSANPLALGTVAPGTSAIPSRQDHVHPTTGLMSNPLTTNGDVIYGVGSTPTRLALGTAGQAFVVNSGATAPVWSTLTLENLPDAWTKRAVAAATTANITSLAGGAPNTLDGVTLSANDRILVKDQSTPAQNGIYIVQTLGTGANGTWVRSADASTAPFISGGLVSVDQGSVNGGLAFDNDFKTTDTLGTTAMVWNRVVDVGYSMNIGTTSVLLGRASGALTLAGITLTTPTIADFTNATHTHAAASSGGLLTTLGTVSTGTWNGTLIAGQYGGTGVANTGKTLTLSGNVIIGSSTDTVTLNTGGATSVTLPTSGTLVNTAVTTLSSLVSIGTITTGVWNAGALTSSGTVSATGLAGSLLSSASPLALGTTAPGTSAIPSRQDHVHPTTGLGVDSLLVHLAGTETITGAKQFNAGVGVNVAPSVALHVQQSTGTDGIRLQSASGASEAYNIYRKSADGILQFAGTQSTGFNGFSFSTTPSGGSLTERVTIDNGGALTVKAASASSAVLYLSSGTFAPYLQANDGASLAIVNPSATLPTIFWNNGASNIQISSAGKLTVPSSTTTRTGLNIPQGSAPTTPADGDVWTTTAGMYARINGATVGPFGSGGGSYVDLTTTQSIGGAKTFTSSVTVLKSGATAAFQANSQGATGYQPSFLQLTREGASGTATPSNNVVGELRFDGKEAGGGYANFAAISAQIGTNAAGGAPTTMIFATAPSGGGIVTRMVIDASGNVGIGPSTSQAVQITAGATSHGIELGRQDNVSSTPYIDFHSGTTGANDYDARIQATGGSAASGGGTLNFFASTFLTVSDISGCPTFYLSNNNTDSSGPAVLMRKTPSDNSISPGDNLGTLHFRGVDTSGNERNSAYINVQAGANGATYVPSTMYFVVTNAAGSQIAPMTLDTTGTVILAAPVTTAASLRLPHGTAPTSPTNGDVWTTTGGAFTRINGLTVPQPGLVVSSTAPTPAYTGLMWFDMVGGGTYIYYDSFWVEVGSAGGQLVAPVTITGTNAASVPLTVQGAPSQSTEFFRVQDSSASVKFWVDSGGSTHTQKLVPNAGTTAIAPIQFQTGTNLTSPVQGSVEWDGDNLFITGDTTNGSGREVNVDIQRVYLASAGSAITAGTDFFPSLRPMMKTNKLNHFKYWLMFTKNTAGTVTFQLKNTGSGSSFTFVQATMQLYTQASGAFAAVGDMAIAYGASAATATFPATKSLSAATNYAVLIEGWCVMGGNNRLSITPSAYGAGTITTIVGSTMWCADYGTYNTNYGNLG